MNAEKIFTERPIRITYCWTALSGYLKACIKSLAKQPNIIPSVIAWAPNSHAPFSGLEAGFPRVHILTKAEHDNKKAVQRLVTNTQPDVVVIAGWAHPPYRSLLFNPANSGIRFVMTTDTPILHNWRQWIGKYWVHRLLRRVDMVVVPGDRGFQLMRQWGLPSAKISRLLYAVDYHAFSGAAHTATKENRFVFTGRYIAAKGVDVLVKAYAHYRQAVDKPWDLHAVGVGPLVRLLEGPGIINHGFLQPAAVVDFFAQGGVFILPSRSEPWGQVIVEAAASGMPVLCTADCGAAAEVVHDFYSGRVVPAEDTIALADAMVWAHSHAERLPQMGIAAQQAAKAFSSELWAENQHFLARKLCSER